MDLKKQPNLKPPTVLYQEETESADATKPRPRRPISAAVDLVVDCKGNPHDIHAKEAEGDTAFNRAAETNLSRWRFKPATLDGKPISVFMQIGINIDPF